MPLVAATIAGILTAIIEAVMIVMLMLGEMGGPIDFRIPVLVVACVPLAILSVFHRAKIWWEGAICGLFFGFPVAGICFLILKVIDQGKEHYGQLTFAAITVVCLSVSVLACRAGLPPKPPIKESQ